MNCDRLNAIIGNDNIKKLIYQNALVANKEKTPFPNTMIIGQSGCGKTTFAEAIQELVEVQMYKVHGKTLNQDKGVFHQLLSNMNRNQAKVLLFIDEVHQLKNQAQEAFFPILDKKEVTIIAATTDPGQLLEPFVNRFPLEFTISSYSFEQSKAIIKKYSTAKNYIITKRAIYEIARRGHGVPRTLIGLTDLCYKKARFITLASSEVTNDEVDARTYVDYESVKAVSRDLQIDERGLGRHEYDILKYLSENKVLSIKNLLSMTSIDCKQYEKRYEPVLLKMGFIDKSSSGRRITDKGNAYYNSHKHSFETLGS